MVQVADCCLLIVWIIVLLPLEVYSAVIVWQKNSIFVIFNISLTALSHLESDDAVGST